MRLKHGLNYTKTRFVRKRDRRPRAMKVSTQTTATTATLRKHPARAATASVLSEDRPDMEAPAAGCRR